MPVPDAQRCSAISISPLRQARPLPLWALNGAGKSTLLRILSGELRTRAGAVHLKRRDVTAYRPQELARHRAVLSQSITVRVPFTVAEIVRMGAGATRSRSMQAFVESALAEVGLATFRDRIITTLSG